MAARQPAASASTSSIEKRTDSFFLFLTSASHMPGRLPVRGKHIIFVVWALFHIPTIMAHCFSGPFNVVGMA